MRKIYGPVKERINWRIRSNPELKQLFEELDTIMKVKQMKWGDG